MFIVKNMDNDEEQELSAIMIPNTQKNTPRVQQQKRNVKTKKCPFYYEADDISIEEPFRRESNQMIDQMDMEMQEEEMQVVNMKNINKMVKPKKRFANT